MKLTIFAVVIFIILGITLGTPFFRNLGVKVLDSLSLYQSTNTHQTITSTQNGAKNGKLTSAQTSTSPQRNVGDVTTSSSSTFTPPNFRGPTGQPYVQGPSEPPPNY